LTKENHETIDVSTETSISDQPHHPEEKIGVNLQTFFLLTVSEIKLWWFSTARILCHHNSNYPEVLYSDSVCDNSPA
jgi:hypothetical protein